MFECKVCKYTSIDNNNFKRHINSISHTILVKKNEKIQKKRLENKLKKEESLTKNIKSIGKQLKTNDKKLNQIKKQQLITDDKVNKINTNVKKITDYVEFLNKYCPDVEPLEELTEDEVVEILKLKKNRKFKFEEMIVYSIKYKKLATTLGNLILNEFLTPDNSKKQRIWTSDISRLIYLIFQIVGKKGSWVRDKRGVMFIKLIITPIINKLKELMKKYIKYNLDQFDNNDLDNPKNAFLLEYSDFAKHFEVPEFCNKLMNEMIKHMASKFSIAINKKELEDVC